MRHFDGSLPQMAAPEDSSSRRNVRRLCSSITHLSLRSRPSQLPSEHRRSSTLLQSPIRTRMLSSRAYSSGDPLGLTPRGDAEGAQGFLAFVREESLETLSVITNARKNREAATSLPPPPLIGEVHTLFAAFPSFPRAMVIALVLQMEGNCSEVYRSLVERAWEPHVTHSLFQCKKDEHFAIPYYFGMAPNAAELRKLFRRKDIGSFLTCYRYCEPHLEDTNQFEGFRYFVTFKNRAGALIERAVSVPSIPPPLMFILELSEGIRAPKERRERTNYLPFLRGAASLS